MEGKYFLIVVDCQITTHGVPDDCISDNGPAFTSSDFLCKNGIRQVLVDPYHPSSNGQAQRIVQNVKEALKKMTEDWSGKDLSVPLSRYLLTQLISTHAMTSNFPAEILMGRKLNTLLDKVFPNFAKTW